MKAKLVVDDGREIEIEISEEEFLKFKPKMKTGYERVKVGGMYWHPCLDRGTFITADTESALDNDVYDNANYYSDKTVAVNNTRADKLMRQLRRFAVEHREYEMDWKNIQAIKYYIFYDYNSSQLLTDYNYDERCFGCIYFRSIENAKLAIETFHDELIWYFTEYKDSL